MTDITVLWRGNRSHPLPRNRLHHLVHNVWGKEARMTDGAEQFFVKPFSVTLFVKQHRLAPWEKVSSNDK